MMLREQKGITVGVAALIIAVTAVAIGGGLYLVTRLPSSAPEKFYLTVSKEGTGHVVLEPEGGVYEKGEEVTVRAFPPPGGGFEGWSGDVSKDSSTITVVVNSEKHLVAHFWKSEEKTQWAEAIENHIKYLYPPDDVGYKITSRSETRVKGFIYLKGENDRVPFEDIELKLENGHWNLYPGPWDTTVRSPSENLRVTGYSIDKGSVGSPEWSGMQEVLERVTPTVRNGSDYPAFVSSVHIKIENSTDTFTRSYPAGIVFIGRISIGIVPSGRTVEIGYQGGPPPLAKWSSDGSKSFLRMSELAGENFRVTLTLKDGERTTLAKRTFPVTFGDLSEKYRNVKLGSSLADLDLSGSTPEKTSNLVEEANKFAFELYSRLAEENKNTFISPYSIHTALAMTYEGASGETAEEMETALNLPPEDDVRLPAFAELHKKLNSDRAVELKTANALWPQENFPFYKNYLEAVKKHYLARIESLDYSSNSDAAVKRINEWAAEHTENKIKEILQNLNPLTRLVLTNAIYFKGTWLMPFDESLTENEPFHLPDGSTVQVPMMQFHENRLEENEFYYSETDELKALKLPYTGKEMSMIFLLPKDRSKGIGWLKKHVTENEFETIRSKFEKKQMSKIKIPKFEYKVKYKRELKSALKDLGMSAAFIPREANFSEMSPLGKELFIQKIVHKAYVKVNEKGTEAAAVTAVVVGMGASPNPKPSFVADRPFMFLIKDEKTGSILFVGSVANPQSE